MSLNSGSLNIGATTGNISLKGNYDASTNTPDLDCSPEVGSIKKGAQYVISVAGTFFSETVQSGDSIIAKQDDPTTISHWITVENNLSADPFARTNHTGSQAAGTITGLSTSATTDTTSASNICSGTLPLARLSGITNNEISSCANITTSKISGFDTQVRTNRLDQLASPTGDIDLNSNNITNVNYQDLDNIAAPSDPAAGKGRMYVKTLDGYNDGIFIKVKKAGGFVEVQIA